MDTDPLNLFSRRAFLAAAVSVGVVGCTADRDSPPVFHQEGVLAPSPAAAGVAAFDVTARGRAELTVTLRAVSSLGATVAVGASLFDGRFGLRAPRLLAPMPAFRNDVLEPDWCHGDLLLQVLADTPAQVDAVLKTPVEGLVARWRIDGHRLPGARNPFGFSEGAGNPVSSDVDRAVWVGPDDDEPSWCVGGTYQVVRLIRLAMPTWDRKSTEEQEFVFGRHKESGAPLGKATEDSAPDLAALPVDAHIRRARPEGDAPRILRRGYPFAAEPGQLFICYQRDVERGFAATQRRLAGEALEKYVLPFGGGYYFTLPGVTGAKEDYLGRSMIESS